MSRIILLLMIIVSFASTQDRWDSWDLWDGWESLEILALDSSDVTAPVAPGVIAFDSLGTDSTEWLASGWPDEGSTGTISLFFSDEPMTVAGDSTLKDTSFYATDSIVVSKHWAHGLTDNGSVYFMLVQVDSALNSKVTTGTLVLANWISFAPTTFALDTIGTSPADSVYGIVTIWDIHTTAFWECWDDTLIFDVADSSNADSLLYHAAADSGNTFKWNHPFTDNGSYAKLTIIATDGTNFEISYDSCLVTGAWIAFAPTVADFDTVGKNDDSLSLTMDTWDTHTTGFWIGLSAVRTLDTTACDSLWYFSAADTGTSFKLPHGYVDVVDGKTLYLLVVPTDGVNFETLVDSVYIYDITKPDAMSITVAHTDDEKDSVDVVFLYSTLSATDADSVQVWGTIDPNFSDSSSLGKYLVSDLASDSTYTVYYNFPGGITDTFYAWARTWDEAPNYSDTSFALCEFDMAAGAPDISGGVVLAADTSQAYYAVSVDVTSVKTTAADSNYYKFVLYNIETGDSIIFQMTTTADTILTLTDLGSFPDNDSLSIRIYAVDDAENISATYVGDTLDRRAVDYIIINPSIGRHLIDGIDLRFSIEEDTTNIDSSYQTLTMVVLDTTVGGDSVKVPYTEVLRAKYISARIDSADSKGAWSSFRWQPDPILPTTFTVSTTMDSDSVVIVATGWGADDEFHPDSVRLNYTSGSYPTAEDNGTNLYAAAFDSTAINSDTLTGTMGPGDTLNFGLFVHRNGVWNASSSQDTVGFPDVAPAGCSETPGNYVIWWDFEKDGNDHPAVTLVDDADTSYTTNVACGTYSCNLDEEDAVDDIIGCTSSFTAAANFYLHFLLYIDNLSGDSRSKSVQFMTLVGGSELLTLYITAAGNMQLYNGTSNTTGSTTYSEFTWYHVWLRYTQGTGANGISTIWVGAANSWTRPETPEVNITNGNATGTVRDVRLQQTYGVSMITVDKIIGDDSDFSEVCECE